MNEKVNVRRIVVDTVHSTLTSCGAVVDSAAGPIKIERDETNPYVLLVSVDDKVFKVRFKES